MERSNFDDGNQHEVYVASFESFLSRCSVMAWVTLVMYSYNPVNMTYACENNHTINGIFQGFVMSDWDAQDSMISAMTGLDMTMPGDITVSRF